MTKEIRLYLYLLFFNLTGLTVITYFNPSASSGWPEFFALPILTLVGVVVASALKRRSGLDRALIWLSVIVICILFGACLRMYHGSRPPMLFNWYSLLFLFSYFSISCVLLGKKDVAIGWNYFVFLTVGVILFFGFMDLPNWVFLATMGGSSGPLRSAMLPLGFVLGYIIFRERPDFKSRKNILPWLVHILFFGISCALAFRRDRFFSGSSELHWEYYVGPIRAIRSGQWLLYSQPSQYGFLNIIWTSIFPGLSWNSFFYAQSTLLLLGASLCYFTLCTLCRSLLARVSGAAVMLCAFFFADPALIGPSLYPSSSVMRFFPVYLFIFLAVSLFKTPIPISLRKSSSCLGVIWALGCLWSAECAVYVSTAFWGLIGLRVLAEIRLGQKLQPLLISCFIPLGYLIAALTLITAYYLVEIKHVPDFVMLFEHALKYAGGFGSVTIFKYGGPWLLIIPIISMAHLLVVADLKLLFTSTPRQIIFLCLLMFWAVSSYYVGRAVPNNITAILPIIILLLFVVCRCLVQIRVNVRHTAVPMIFMSFCAIAFWTLMGNYQFGSTFDGVFSKAPLPSENIHPMEPGMAKAFETLGITADSPIVFDGDQPTGPRNPKNNGTIVYDKTFILNPLALAEEPIKPKRQDEFLRRSQEFAPKKAWFVFYTSSKREERFIIWMKKLREYWTIKESLKSPEWVIYELTKK